MAEHVWEKTEELAQSASCLAEAAFTLQEENLAKASLRNQIAAVGLMAAGAGIMIVGHGPAALVVGATTLAGGSVTMGASWDGIACCASLKGGRMPSGIELSAVRAIIIVERGPGRCFYFPYGSQGEAMHDLDASFARLTSRILFNCQNGSLQEVCKKGAPFARNTIRKAATSLEKVLQHSGKGL